MVHATRLPRLLTLAALIGLALAGTAGADTLTLQWVRSSSTEVTGYVVHIGTEAGVYSQTVDVGNTDTYVFNTAIPGQRYYFAVLAYAGALRSALSTELSGFSNAYPTLASPGPQSGTAGQPVSLQLIGSDPLGDTLSYSATGLPAGVGMSSVSGLITGIPAAPGAYVVTVNAFDGVLTTTQSFTWTIAAASPASAGTNVALASAGATASASSTYAAFSPNWVINGDRAGANWGVGTGGGWHDLTGNAYPDWVQIDFAAAHAIDRVNVFSVQDNVGAPTEPTATQTFSAYGVRAFELQYWTGAAWATIPGTTVSGNNLVRRTVTFSPVTTQKIRVVITGTADGYSRLIEVEAFTADNITPALPPSTPDPTPTPPAQTINVALASAGATASASSAYGAFTPDFVINGDRAGTNWGVGTGGGWHDLTGNAYPDWVQIDFAAAYAIDRVNVFSVQDNVAAPSEPTAAQTFSAYGVRAFELQHWTGSAWATIPGTTVTGNNLVWRTVTFSPVTTQKIRVVITGTADGYSRLIEVEAFTADNITPALPPPTPDPTPTPPAQTINVALASAGATASASSAYGAFTPDFVINGDRAGTNWGVGTGGGWHDLTGNAYPDWVQIDFAAAYAIDRVNVFSVQDNVAAPSEPTAAQTFSAYGVRAFELQYWTGSAWATIPGTTVTGNNLVWRTVTFSPVTTQKIRVVITGTVDGYSRLIEVEAFTTTSATQVILDAGTNVAAAATGATASASSTYSPAFAPAAAIDGERSGAPWGNGGGWNDATTDSFPDWLQVDFAATFTISQVNVFTLQDSFLTPSEPVPGQTFQNYGLRDFELQYWTGTDWALIPGTTVTGNSLVWRTIVFSPITTTKLRIVMTGAADGNSRITEIEAYTGQIGP